jgi:protein gp37
MDQVSGIEPPCDHLYAEAQKDARYGCVEWGGPCRRTSEATRRARYRWDREAAVAGERRRVFCMSLGDFWDNQVPDEWRIEALNTVRQCRSLDWLILTKRPLNIRKMLPPDWVPHEWSHVWLGATVENMIEARRRVPALLRVPAGVHCPSHRCLSHLICGPGWGAASIGSLTAARQAPGMPVTWNRTGRETCAISAATQVPHFSSSRCGSGKRSRPI